MAVPVWNKTSTGLSPSSDYGSDKGLRLNPPESSVGSRASENRLKKDTWASADRAYEASQQDKSVKKSYAEPSAKREMVFSGSSKKKKTTWLPGKYRK